MVNIPDSGLFLNPKLPSDSELQTMTEEELIQLASDLKFTEYTKAEHLHKLLPGVIKAQRHIVENGLSDFTVKIQSGHLIERVRTLFPSQAEQYLMDIGVDQLKQHTAQSLKASFVQQKLREKAGDAY